MTKIMNEKQDLEENIDFKAPILQVNEWGSPINQIDVEALDTSIRAFWRFHEKKVWLVLIISGVLLLMRLIA